MRAQWAIGLACAAGLWTKSSFGLVLPVVALGCLLAWRNGRRPSGALFAAWGRTLLLPLLLVAPWLARNVLLYGDLTGAARLAQIPGFGAQARGYGQMIGNLGFWHLLLRISGPTTAGGRSRSTRSGSA